MTNKIYTLEDIQAFFKVSKPTALSIVHAEGFPKIVIGKRLLIPKNALEKWCIDNTTYEKIENLQKMFEENNKKVNGG